MSGIIGVHHAGCSKRPSSKAAASEEARRTLRYVETLNDARTLLADFFSILLGDSRGLSFVKREPDPKRRTLVDGTLHSDGPAMFLDDTFDDREA